MSRPSLRLWSSVLCSLVLGLGLGSIAHAQELAWKAFDSADGRFAVDFPGAPSQRTNAYPTAKWGTLEQHIYALEVPSTAVFYVSYIDYPKGAVEKENIEQLLDGARDNAVKNAKGKLVREDKVTQSGFPGRAIVFEGRGNLVFTAHYYLAKGRLYSALVYVPKASSDSPHAKRFLDSFKLRP